MKRIKPLLVFGTRPEAIKMAPVVLECQRRAADVEPVTCITGQHREMLSQVIQYFDIEPDYDLDVMQPSQSLATLTARCLEGLDEVVSKVEPSCVVAQGDTTTVLAAALVSFYRKLPFVHVEAGLRTGNLLSPWPEEMNRRFTGLVATLHCAPTKTAADVLRKEGVPDYSIRVTGNTVIDALLIAREREVNESSQWSRKYSTLGNRPVVLITGHRRENFGQGFENICAAIAELAAMFEEVEFLYPVHLNPNVQEPVARVLGGIANVHLVPPASYPEFVWLMDRAKLILTDSGGVQEEAPTFRKPVLVMRDTTERPEAVEMGAAKLIGTKRAGIVDAVACLLLDDKEYQRCQAPTNPYGDGCAATRIVDWLQHYEWSL